MALPPPTQDPEAVRDLADQILAQGKYKQPPESVVDKVTGWIFERLADLVGGLIGGGGGAVIAWLILLGAVAGVVALLVRYGRVTLLQVPPPVEGARVMVELTRTADEWRREAARLEALGRWREGLRCRHRGLVAALVQRGLVRDQAGRTAGEYVQDVAASAPEVAPAFAAATELFEAAWYGGAATGEAEAGRFEALAADVLSERART